MTEKYLHLLVKGTPQEAAEAAAQRGIPWSFAGIAGGAEVIGRGPTQCFDQAVKWFHETDIYTSQPSGALLFFCITEG